MVLIFVNYLNLIGIEIEAAQRESLKRAGQKKKKKAEVKSKDIRDMLRKPYSKPSLTFEKRNTKRYSI